MASSAGSLVIDDNSNSSTGQNEKMKIKPQNDIFDPISELRDLSSDLSNIDLSTIRQRDFDSLKSVTSPKDRSDYLSQLCETKAHTHPQWLLLAGRVKVKYLRSIVPSTFSKSCQKLRPILNSDYHQFVMDNSEVLNSMIVEERDMTFNSFAMGNLMKSYLGRLKKDSQTYILETPQYMYLRIATYLWYPKNGEDLTKSLENIRDMYNTLSLGQISMASPCMFNAGLIRSQLASCFVMVVGDCMQSICKGWADTAVISMNSGGIGIDFSSLRHSEIGQYGESGGVVPWIGIFSKILQVVDQCFHPDTIVYTTNDGPKPISQVSPGDGLINSDGKRGIVLNPIVHNLSEREIPQVFHELSIKHYIQPIIVSEEHPILSIRHKKGSTFKNVIKKLENGIIVPEYIDVKDLDQDYLVAIPIPTYEKDLPRYSSEDCRMYGILIGDGSITVDRNEAKVHLSSETKQETLQFIEGYLTRNNIKYYKTENENTHTIVVGWTLGPFFPFNRSMLYDENGEKKIYPSFLNLPKEKLKMLFFGVMETDGTYRRGQEVTLEMSSFQVIESIRYILLRLGVPTSGYVRDRVGSISYLTRSDTITTQKMTAVLRIPKTEEICEILGREDPSPVLSYFEYDGKLWSRVTKNQIIDDPKTDHVYDLEMRTKKNVDYEITANFMTCIGTAHNGGKRKGSGTGYLGLWHIDIQEFLDLKKPTGPEEMRARHMTYAVSIPDEFMRRVEKDEMWTLFCPNKAKNLDVTWGLDFESLYEEYEQKVKDGKMTHYRQIKARDLWSSIIQTQIETGMPFMLYRDAVNRKSNQQNLGTTRLSNLCMEISLYTDEKNIPSCNLGSVNLSACVNDGKFDYELLHNLTRKLVRYINQVVDRTYYPKEIPEIEKTNLRNRPLGIGVQALADAFALMDVAWIDKEARKINEMIAETMYHAAVSESVEMSKESGPYETFKGSPASKGMFQFDLWDMEKFQRDYSERRDAHIDYQYLQENIQNRQGPATNRYDWDALRQDMVEYGMKNSLLIALMPTASSASILGNNESFEPYTRHVYARTVLSGQYIVVNPHLVRDLQNIDLWNGSTIKQILKDGGSIINLSEDGLKEEQLQRLKFLKKKYLTVFEIPQKILLDMSLDRGRYVCQTQSLNCWMQKPTYTKLNAYHFYGWKGGAKTGMYYMHQPARVDPINHALDSIVSTEKKNTKYVCTDEVCVSCST